jgi:hypothetical protein
MKNVSEKSGKENQNIVDLMFNICFPKIVPFYKMMWKHTVELARPQMTT